MDGWSTHSGMAVSLSQANIDTDQLIPARFMSVPRSQGYGPYLLHDVRRDAQGVLLPDYPLNQHSSASVIVAGRNFGSGSSREAAVYALVDAGVRAVIAPSFGDIFSSNAVNNGLLPAQVTQEAFVQFDEHLGQTSQDLYIDIATRQISLDAIAVQFTLDDSLATKLINGWDDIDLTRNHSAAIKAFKDHRSETAAWAWPAQQD